MATKTATKKKELKNKHFQYPDDLCEFVNTHNVQVHSIVSFNGAQALYYYNS